MLHDDIQEKLGELYGKALAFEKSGQHVQAASLYRQCLLLDPQDHCGASVRLASLGMGNNPQKAPDAYVATLFDQHANDFDKILTGDLGYAVPVNLGEILLSINRQFPKMLDLGCGTGLSGLTLGPICDHTTGVDISTNMIDIADERECYDALFINEAVHFLEEWQRAEGPDYQPFDLIVATDVLPYIGALEALFSGVSANLNPGGGFAFSCETLPDVDFKGQPWCVTPNQRFAHQASYLRELLHTNKFTDITNFEPITVRTEEGQPIPGWLIVAWQK